MSKGPLIHARLRKVVATVGAVVLAVASSSSAGAVSPAPVGGGPAGQGPCAAQAAAARSHSTVAALRAFGDCEIGRREKTLASLAAVVEGSNGLTASDRLALESEIGASESGLAGIQTTIDGQTSIPALRLAIVQIASKYRLYVLVAPQVYLVNAADDVLAMRPALAQMAGALAGRIAATEAAGRDVGAARVSLATMNAEIAAAMALASPLPARLLPLTAADWNAGRAGPALAAARVALASSRDHLRNAVKAGRATIVALR